MTEAGMAAFSSPLRADGGMGGQVHGVARSTLPRRESGGSYARPDGGRNGWHSTSLQGYCDGWMSGHEWWRAIGCGAKDQLLANTQNMPRRIGYSQPAGLTCSAATLVDGY